MQKDCDHKETKEIWEDHVFMGMIYYGKECKKCGYHLPEPPGPLELGTYR